MRGGQHINKTDSAVRITHLPTSIVVECQDDRSQHRNKAQAMSILAARIKDAQISEQQSKRASERKTLIGSGDRSERIRTYNFPQGRITDHRINLTLYKIDFVMDGDLSELIEALNNEHQADFISTARRELEMESLFDIQNNIVEILKNKIKLSTREARTEARFILEHELKMKHAHLISNQLSLIKERKKNKIYKILEERIQYKPLAYIIGEWDFYGLNFFVSQETLIPRQDTELLIDLILKKYSKNQEI